MPDDRQLVPFAVNTYRYLRLAIVVVVLALMSSVIIEVVHTGCWQGSISAYYYTPVHAVFVGALVALGVSMIAIKGSTDVEDMLLNVAGVLAPIVAFVPTSPPTSTDTCPATALLTADPQAFIDNNVLSFAIGGAIALGVAVIAVLLGKSSIRRFDPSTVVGLVLSGALLAVGLIWYYGFRDNFLEHAHGGAAAVMFLLVAVVMVISALRARRVHRDGPARWYWVAYAALAASMVLSAIGVSIALKLDRDWRHQILLLEILELTAFALFWVLQTLEHWNGGVPTGADRSVRPA
jgi:hypothetical protein